MKKKIEHDLGDLEGWWWPDEGGWAINRMVAAAAAAKSLQSCPTLCDPIDCSPPGSPVPGILQARSGLPFPSPMHESEKWKWSCSVVSDSLWPHGLQPTRLLHPWDFPGKSTGVGCHCLLRIGWLGRLDWKHNIEWDKVVFMEEEVSFRKREKPVQRPPGKSILACLINRKESKWN